MRIARSDDHILLVTADDGVGIRARAEEVTSFGQTLMRTLARQLDAVLTVEANPGGGTRVVVRIPAAMALSTQA
jgi:signal transduction histidine kinase